MQHFSPITHILAKNGLQNILFSSEQEKDFYSFNQTSENEKPRANLKQESSFSKAPAHKTGKESPANHLEIEENKVKKNSTLKLENWPKTWLDVHKKFNLPSTENMSSKVQIAWTYAGLEQDVMGQANQERQSIVRKLLQNLNHQKGTHIFIPYALPSAKNQEEPELAIEVFNNEEISLFWSAMRLVRPRILLIFGSSARNAIGAPKSMPLQKSQMGSLQVLQMHKFETLAKNQEFYNNTLVFLQSYLNFCKKN